MSKDRISSFQYHERLRRLDIQLSTGYEGPHQRNSELYSKFSQYRTLTSDVKLCARLQVITFKNFKKTSFSLTYYKISYKVDQSSIITAFQGLSWLSRVWVWV